MSKRLLVLSLVLAAAVLVLATRGRWLQTRGPTCGNCNVVLISADALRADHLGCYGYRRDTSPSIDRLAGESIRFAHAYSTSAWTLPGHMGMLTGRFPATPSEFTFTSGHPFPESYVTLAQALKSSGYATAGFTGGGFVSAYLGFGRGFDVYETSSASFEGNVPRSAQWLSERDLASPFFLFLHGFDVHAPYDPPQDLRLRFIDAVPEKCRGVKLECHVDDLECRRSDGGRRYLVSQYDAEIVAVDRMVQSLLDELERQGLREKTIIAFTSDHGETLMDGGGGVCGHAGDLDESVFRVPLVLHVPGLGARVIETRVSLADLAPTLLEILGLPVPETMHGESVVPFLDGPRRGRQINGVTGFDSGNVVLATIAGDEKLVMERPHPTAPWRYELYDLDKDPRARRNQVKAGVAPPEAVAALEKRMRAWMEKIGLELDADVRPGAPPPPEVRDRLEALGYR